MIKLGQIVFGAVLIAAGVIFGLNLLGLTEIEVFFDGWWTLFIIVPCFLGLFSKKDRAGNFFGLVVGIFLLLSAQEIVTWKLMVPILIVCLGIRLIVKATPKPQINPEKETQTVGAVFSGQKVRAAGEPFYGANLLALFGGITYDLRDADVKDGAMVKVFAIFGGVDLLVPDHLVVKSVSMSLFGGAADKRKASEPLSEKTLTVHSFNLFGGTDIK